MTQSRTVASSYGRRDFLIRRLLLVADVSALVLALLVMVSISGRASSGSHVPWALAMIPFWVVLLGAYGLYSRDIKRISHSTVDDLPWVLHAVLVGCLLSWLYFSVLPVSKLTFFEILLFGGTAAAAIVLFRSMTRRLITRALGPDRVLFIGEGESMDVLVRKMAAHPEYGLEPVTSPSASLDLGAALARYKPDRIVLSDTQLDESTLLALIHRCKELSVKVSLLPRLFSALGPSVEVDDVEGVTVLGINPPVLPRFSRYMKRALDLAVALCVLLLAAPFVALIAFAIKVESRGPVFFKQWRIGKGGEPFKLLKFRTMVVGAEQRTQDLMAGSQHEGWLKLENDPRITRIGKLLRLASLDEAPQFWNILKGEMSLVGPRPLIESEDRQVGGWARSRLELTPGLTGLWQVLGRTNIPFEEMVKLDYVYVTNWSLWSDVRLILRTLPVVVARRGAN